jgi:hypothetical protein
LQGFLDEIKYGNNLYIQPQAFKYFT